MSNRPFLNQTPMSVPLPSSSARQAVSFDQSHVTSEPEITIMTTVLETSSQTPLACQGTVSLGAIVTLLLMLTCSQPAKSQEANQNLSGESDKKKEASPPPREAPQRPPGRAGGGFGGPIVLGPDDVAFYAVPPDGFRQVRESVPQGKLEMIEYESKTVGTTRKMQVYTPPGYTMEQKYPVVYLLHGIGGDESEWQRFASPNVILDNLIADGKAVPMIVVMPNGRAQKNDRAEGNIFASAPAFATFERDLLDDVIPTIEAKYSVDATREQRALAGLSMGGGQTLNFGLAHLDQFGWLGAFSAAPNTKRPQELIPDVEAAKNARLKLLWISCGNKDGLINVSQGVHQYLKKNGIQHVWHVDGFGHDPQHWSSSLYWFAQNIFQEKAVSTTPPGHSLTGTWTATIDTQIGDQHYEYSIVTKEGQVVGTAVMTLNGTTFRSPLAAVKLDGKRVSFEETMNFQGTDLLITYSGEVNGDTMELTRKVGEFATEKLIARRAKSE